MSVRTITLVLAMLLVSVALRAADDPLIGTWKLNAAKSKYNPGPPPKSQITTYEQTGEDELKFTNHVVDAQGKQNTILITYIFDGKEHPSPEAAGEMFVSRRIDAYTSERLTKKGGTTITTMRRVVSKDGKTLTVSQKGINPRGLMIDNVQVYDKQ